MNPKRRVNFTAHERKELWSRWRQGESLSDIGQALGRHAATIYGVLLTNGGYTPPERIRSTRHLSLEEREDILRGITLGHSYRQIAETLGRAPSTISREVKRNGGHASYRATKADSRAQACARRPKPCLLAGNATLRQIVARKLKCEWSPEQIAGWLKIIYPGNIKMHISHECDLSELVYTNARRPEKRVTCPPAV